MKVAKSIATFYLYVKIISQRKGKNMGEDSIEEIYLELLKKQFCEAKGLRKIDESSKSDLEALKKFIKERQELGRQYNRFLRFLGINITTRNTAELDKGDYDSIIKDYDTLAITPFPIDIDYDRIIDMKDAKVQRYITQNPLYKEDIKEMISLYNNDENDILIGMYGKTYDNDSHKKMRQIVTLSKKIKDYQYKTSLFKDNNNYFIVLYTTLMETKRQFAQMKKALEKGNIIDRKLR